MKNTMKQQAWQRVAMCALMCLCLSLPCMFRPSVALAVDEEAEEEQEQEAKAVELDEGVYILTGVGCSKPLDVYSANQAQGTNVQIYSSNSTLAQRWNIKKVDGHYVLLSAGSNYALDVYGANAESGTNVWLYSENDTKAQLWDFIDNGDGTYTLKSCLGDYALDVNGNGSANGTNVQIYASNGSDAQKWTLKKIDRTVADGLYKISSALDGTKVLDVASGSMANGAKAQVYTSNGTNAQKWQLTYNEKTGYYTILAACSSKALDVPSASTSSGTELNQYTANGTGAQRWTIEQNDDDTYTFVSGCSGLVIDVPSGKANNGTGVQTWSSNGTNAQKWALDSVSLIDEGLYALTSAVDEGYVLDVSSGDTTRLAKIQVWTLNSTLAQKWVIEDAKDGSYTIKSANSGRYLTDSSGTLINEQSVSDAAKWTATLGLDGGAVFVNVSTGKVIDLSSGKAANGTSVGTWASNSTAAQTWHLVSVNPIEEGYYVFYNRSDSNLKQVLDVPGGSTESKVELQTYTYNGTDAQIWYVAKEDDGNYSITNAGSGLALDVYSAKAESGTVVWQYEDNDTTAQRWSFSIGENGGLVIKSALGDFALASDGTAANETDIVIASNSSDESQRRWTYAAADYSAGDGVDIWNDSTYIAKMRSLANHYGSETNYFLTVDTDNGRVVVLKKSGSSWKLEETFNSWVGRYNDNNGYKSNTHSGMRKVLHKAYDLYDDVASGISCARYWTCFNECWTDSANTVGGLVNRYYEGLGYDDGQGFHWVQGKSTTDCHDTMGCVGMELDDCKWIYDNVPLNSGVAVFGYYDDMYNLEDYR